MVRHFLTYWKPKTAQFNISDEHPLDHTAGDQLSKCKRDDVLWIVSVFNGELRLLGRLHVGAVVSQRKAERILRSTNLWEAKWHAIAERGTIEPLRTISLLEHAAQLRFVSGTGRDRLTVARGRVSGLQLQQMRELEMQSALLLETLWWGKAPSRLRLTSVLYEGAVQRCYLTRRTRNAGARQRCVEHYGLRCSICDFDFAAHYGPIAAGCIEVHHLRELAKSRGLRRVDPTKDLRPVCSNCHLVLHLRDPAYSILELKSLLKRHNR